MQQRKYFGIFLISLATLTYEIGLIRLFSIAQWYHFAFMVVSIAMFGFAFSGTFLSFVRLKQPLFKSALLFSFSVLIGFLLVNTIPFDPYRAAVDYTHIFRLVIYYVLLGLPFFFSGLVFAFVLSKHQKKAGMIYFFNLIGGGFGSLLALPIISLFSAKLVIVVTIIGLLASLCFGKNVKMVALLIFLVSLLFFAPLDIKMSEYKELNLALNYPNSEHLLSRQNSFSRVDLVNSSFTRYAPGLSSEFKGELPSQIGVLIDGANMNAITAYLNLSFVEYLPTSIGYDLVENPKVLVINSGAGLDVVAALQANASVVALDTNPIVINLLKEEYKSFSGDVYNKADVFIGHGRSFIKREEVYDIIILSLAGNVLSSSAGLSGLSENYLLTTEAFIDYYEHLSENGVLIITRWLLYPPRESLRLFSLALEIDNAEQKVAMFRSWTTATLLLSKKELTNERIEKIKEFTESNKFDIIYLPSNFTPNRFGKFEEAFYYNSVNEILTNKEKFYSDYLFDVRAVNDDKPFYFNFFRWEKLPELYNMIGGRWQPFLDSGFVLVFLFFQALILSILFILLPLRYKHRINKLPLMYFVCIGIAYMFVEIVLIQKLILLLGQVIYSTALVIFTMLVFSGIGSLVSQKIKIRIKVLLASITCLIVFYSFIMPLFINSLIKFGLITKIVFAGIFIAPLAFLMGMPFPLGIRNINKKLIVWAFGVNGAASVLSTIMVILIALSIGYTKVLIIAAIVYFVGMFFIE